MNELHVVVIVSQVPEFVCKQLRKTVTDGISHYKIMGFCVCVCVCVCFVLFIFFFFYCVIYWS